MNLSHSFLVFFLCVLSIVRECESLVALRQSITEVLDEDLLPTESIEHMCTYPEPPLLDVILEDEKEQRAMEVYRSEFILKEPRSHLAHLYSLEGNISLITSDGRHIRAAIWNNSHFIESNGIWIEPEKKIQKKACTEMHTSGPYVIHKNFFPDNFGHVLPDHFPTWFWTLFLVSEKPEAFSSKLIGSKILVPKNKLVISYFKFWFELFGKEARQLRNKFHFYTTNQIQCFQTAQVSVMVHNVGNIYPWGGRSPFLVLAARSYFDSLLRTSLRSRNKVDECPEGKFIIFYSRAGKSTHHGRRVHNEDEVLRLIRREMGEKNRTERLVVFDGDGMTQEQQYNLFRCATTVIGPHGAGMANVMWTATSPRCEHPVHVIEIVCGKRSERVQPGHDCPFRKTQYFLSATVPWVHFHNIYFRVEPDRNSRVAPKQKFRVAPNRTLIPADTLMHLLHKIWSKNEEQNKLALYGEQSLRFYNYSLGLKN